MGCTAATFCQKSSSRPPRCATDAQRRPTPNLDCQRHPSTQRSWIRLQNLATYASTQIAFPGRFGCRLEDAKNIFGQQFLCLGNLCHLRFNDFRAHNTQSNGQDRNSRKCKERAKETTTVGSGTVSLVSKQGE